jgi:hypothetical protein
MKELLAHQVRLESFRSRVESPDSSGEIDAKYDVKSSDCIPPENAATVPTSEKERSETKVSPTKVTPRKLDHLAAMATLPAAKRSKVCFG